MGRSESLTMPLRSYPIKLTDEQVKAVNAAFSDGTFSEKLRTLISSGLFLRGIVMPDTPRHGGKRKGSGRKTSLKIAD